MRTIPSAAAALYGTMISVVGREAKTGEFARHDTDHGERMLIDLDDASNSVGVFVQAPTPKAFGDDSDRSGGDSVVTGQNATASRGSSHEREVVCVHGLDRRAARGTVDLGGYR